MKKVQLAALAAVAVLIAALFIYTTQNVQSVKSPDPSPVPASAFRDVSVPTTYPEANIASFVPFQPTAKPTPRPTPKPTAKPTPKPRATAKPKAKPKSSVKIGRGFVRGVATWYCRAGISRCYYNRPDRKGVADLFAAPGPELRVALGGNAGSKCPCPWRGKVVTVWRNHLSVNVTLIDWCACGGDHVIDLYWDAWKQLGGDGGDGAMVTW